MRWTSKVSSSPLSSLPREVGKILALVLFSAAQVGCALFQENTGPTPSFSPQEQVFYEPYDKVWRATQLALRNYRMRVNNMDQGVIETEPVRRPNLWMPAHSQQAQPGGVTSWLSIRLLRGHIDSREAIKVSIQKNTQQTADFFSGERSLPSDGLEEAAILYRIQREITLDKAAERAMQ